MYQSYLETKIIYYELSHGNIFSQLNKNNILIASKHRPRKTLQPTNIKFISDDLYASFERKNEEKNIS